MMTKKLCATHAAAAKNKQKNQKKVNQKKKKKRKSRAKSGGLSSLFVDRKIALVYYEISSQNLSWERSKPRRRSSVPFIVSVVYHPADPDNLEKLYPVHLAKPGVAKLINASQATYAGPVHPLNCDVTEKKVTRTAVFVFPSLQIWEKTATDPDVQAVVADAQRIAGAGGVSIFVGKVDVIKEVNVNDLLPNPGRAYPGSVKKIRKGPPTSWGGRPTK